MSHQTIHPSFHELIQKRASYIYASLANNTLFQQIQSIQLPKLQHLWHSKPYEYTTDYQTLRATTPSHSIASFIDHTLLTPTATTQQITALCNEARQHRFASVCVNSSYTSLCKELLFDSPIHITTVAGFPLGTAFTAVKRSEAEYAINVGSHEIDMVIHIGKLIEEDYGYVLHDINEVVRSIPGHIVKVILETSLLNDTQIIDACILSVLAGASYVKTSTGFASGGATIDHIRLMKTVVGDSADVKASGGIRDYHTAVQMLNAGANRLGCSASVNIVQQESQIQAVGGVNDPTLSSSSSVAASKRSPY